MKGATTGATVLCLALLTPMLPCGEACHALDAQTLDQVDTLVRDGLTEQARGILSDWWEFLAPGASRQELQHGLWLRALLATEARAAVRDYVRLTVEYPGGAYSDRAYFRLAQEAVTRDDWLAAVRSVEALARNYPESTVRVEAEAWLRNVRPDPEATPGDPAADEVAQATTGDFAIERGAFAELRRARELEARAVEAGLAARVVRVSGSDLLRVRVGRVADDAAATLLWSRAFSLGLGATVVRDAFREIAVP